MYRPIPKPSPMTIINTDSKNIRVSKTTTALRKNEFNEYRHKYYFGFPENSNYNICKQRSSSIFMTPNKFYSYKTLTTGTINGNPGCDGA